MRKLEGAATNLRVVFVTVDPQRDTPEQLQRYLSLFHPEFIGLTGSETDVQRAMNAFQVTATRRDIGSASGYAMDHSAFTYVVDKQGRMRELLTFGASVEDIVNDARALLNE